MADLKKVYVAVDEQTALVELDSFDEKWGGSNTPKSQYHIDQTGQIYTTLSEH